jgi:hypothetical protein
MAKQLSVRKLEANRQNAKRSTGPRAGKRRSRWNSLKHGLTAKTTLVPGFEDPKEYRKLIKAYRKALRPKGALEESLVQELAACRFKVLRGFRAERNELAAVADGAREEFVEAEIGLPDDEEEREELRSLNRYKKRAAKAEKKARRHDFFYLGESMELLGRYQTAARRHFDAVLTMLLALQRERKKTKKVSKNQPGKESEAAQPHATHAA